MDHYPPPCQETNTLTVPDLDFDPIFDLPRYKKLARTVQEAKEEGMKLKGMREYRFGEYSEEIPMFDKSLYPCIPLPTSTARPFLDDFHSFSDANHREEYKYKYLPKNRVKWQRYSGQQLCGSMIPHTSVELKD